MYYHKGADPSTEFCRLLWQNKAFLLTKTVFDYTCAVFRRSQTITELHIKWHRKTIPAKSHQHAPQRKPPDTTIHDTFAISKRFVKKVSCSRRFVFVCLLWGPFGSSRSLGKIPTFGPATPTGRPNPAKPVLLLGNESKLFYKFLFVHFYDLHSAAFFARFSKILASIGNFS